MVSTTGTMSGTSGSGARGGTGGAPVPTMPKVGGILTGGTIPWVGSPRAIQLTEPMSPYCYCNPDPDKLTKIFKEGMAPLSIKYD